MREPPRLFTTVPATYLIRGYEAIRSQQLGTVPRETGLGRGLILRRGMAEWMTVWAGGWSDEPSHDVPRPDRAARDDLGPTLSNTTLQTDLTRVLAGMVLATASPQPQEIHS